ncbi:hypothetical protein L596_013697 [Steinernema carpocapsae]|uniref:Uncharacterized protein n=1 Tax=Steinernema carpocapsae TaxID=34508 RepID=A0A4V6A557_STECR|nr:hypothetical protein L596_013697 [Steinernema carpocapsae]
MLALLTISCFVFMGRFTLIEKKPDSGSKGRPLRIWLSKENAEDGTRKDGSSSWPAKLFKKPQKKAVTLPKQRTAPNL